MKYIFVFCFGIILGSFYSLCVDRIPKEESILHPNSHCNNCNIRLKWYDLIPLLSFINLKGKCRYCNKRIGIENIAIEVLTGIVFVILFKYFNFSLSFIKYLVLFSILIVSAFIDYNTQYIFFKVSIVGVTSGFLFLILDILNNEKIQDIILRVLVPLLIVGIIMFIVKKIRGIDGIGYGDLEVFLFLSLYLSLKVMFLSMYLSVVLVSLIGIIRYIRGDRRKYVAFVPYISVATFISVVFYEDIINYYLLLIRV
ncbi:MAG: prepilin peptidase [Clostridium perfringens]|nr:prepilin peptidase [Clostridium perfringens]